MVISMQKLRSRFVSLLLVVALSACGGGGAQEASVSTGADTEAISTGADTEAISTDSASDSEDGVPVKDSAPPARSGTITIGDITLLSEGEADLATLNRNEVCGLVTAEELATALGAKSPPGDRGWSQDEGESFCEQAYQEEFDGVEMIHSVWGVERTAPTDWATANVDMQETMSDLRVADLKARAIVKGGEPGQGQESVRLLVEISPDRTLAVAVDSWRGADIAKATSVAEAVLKNLKNFTPTPEPAMSAKVSSPMEFTAPQLCSLLREPAISTLVDEGFIPGSETYLLQGDELTCARGGAKLILTIRLEKPFRLDDEGVAATEIAGRPAETIRTMYEGRLSTYEFLVETDGGHWVSLVGQSVSDTPETEKLLREEIEFIMAEIKLRTR